MPGAIPKNANFFAPLFAQVTRPGSVFELLLEKHFDGEPDPRTLEPLLTTCRY